MTTTEWLDDWPWSWQGGAISGIVIGAYLALWLRARRLNGAGAATVVRLGLFVLVAAVPLVTALLGPLAAEAKRSMTGFAGQVAVLDAVVPVGIALARPVDVCRAARGAAASPPTSRSRLLRLLTFPLVASTLAATSLLLVFLTGYGDAALRSPWVFCLLAVQLLTVGSLVMVPLLADGLYPAWAGSGVKVLTAVADGLIDAVPGIVLMTRSHRLMRGLPAWPRSIMDQRYAGGTLLAVTEAVGLPLLIAVLVEWFRDDTRRARVLDARLDDELGAGQSLARPWWLHDDPPHA